MRLHLLAVLSIALSVTACATSSPPDQAPPDLAAAESRAQEAVDHPQLPAVLQQCQGGTLPWTDADGMYHCQMPPDLQAALDAGSPMDVVAAKAIGDLQKETDLRFEATHWSDHAHGPAPAEPPAKQDKPKPPSWQFWNW
jgi:hypothetical protein